MVYEILTNVSLTLGYTFPDFVPVYYLPKQLLKDFLLAFALCLAVNVLIIPVTSRTIFLVFIHRVRSDYQRSFEAYLTTAIKFLEAHENFLTPPSNFLSKQHEQAMLKAKGAYRAAFIKLATDKSDIKHEFAYGVLSTDELSDMFKLSRKILWPLMGVGTVGSIISEILRSARVDRVAEEEKESLELVKEDVLKAITFLEQPCREISGLCREGIEHILCTLQMGKYSKKFMKKKRGHDDENPSDIGTSAFIARYDTGLETFQGKRTNDLAQFYNDSQSPSQGLFLVLFVQFLLYAVAQEIRTLIVHVDNIRESGSLTKKRIILPRFRSFWKGIIRIFHVRKAEDVAEAERASEDGDVYYAKSFTGRVKRAVLTYPTNQRNGN